MVHGIVYDDINRRVLYYIWYAIGMISLSKTDKHEQRLNNQIALSNLPDQIQKDQG
jgi:hypothetical protein